MRPREGEPLSALMIRQAMDTLAWNWDGAYTFSVRQDGTCAAERADGLGVVTAASPAELADKVQADYSARRVPRDGGKS